MQLLLSAADHATADRSAEFISREARQRGILFMGPIPMARKGKDGPYRRIFMIRHAEPEQLAALQDVQLPAGLDIEFKM
jgi:ribosomal protein S10